MKLSRWIGIGAVALLAYVIIGYFMLVPARNNIDARTGDVWNALETGAEKITTLQNQVEVPTDLVGDIMENLTTARNDILAAQETGDLQGALDAANQANVEFNALVEAYPEIVDLGPLYVTLMDETSGAFNRVSYARTQLISTQAGYNTTCDFFVLSCNMLGGRVEVLGANSNPAESMNIPEMGSD